MPSSQLALLCEQIEKQNTDHFGKFYMYVSLLNTLTARNKTFADGLPKYSSSVMFWRKNHLNIGGELPVEFTKQLDLYSREFINTQPHWSKTLYNIVMAYVRKGKITDLTYIIDQMLHHLAAIHGRQSHNHEIYKYINFDEKKEGLVQFIQQISDFNHLLLSIADSGCNTALSLLAVTTGAILVLASVASIVPLIIGLPLLIGGGYGIYHYVTSALAQAEQVNTQLEKIGQKMNSLPQDDSLFGDRNHRAFYAAAVKPLPYAAVTAADQLIFDESQQKDLTKYRESMDEMSRFLSI